MKRYIIGQRLIYTKDGSMVDFMGYAEHDRTGAYVSPCCKNGPEMYIDVRQLETTPCDECGTPIDTDIHAEELGMCVKCSNKYYDHDGEE
jgi:hypothetical protein